MSHRLTTVCRAIALLLPAMATLSARGHMPRIELDEMTHAADLIFIGTVTESSVRKGHNGMLLTDVALADLDVVLRRERAAAFTDTITLTFAGGTDGDIGMRACCVPTLQPGERYLLFTIHDGRTTLCPTLGGSQGVFRIQRDDRTDAAYPLSLAGHAILGVSNGRTTMTERILALRDGEALVEQPAWRMAAAPLPGDPERSEATTRRVPEAVTPMTLDAFTDAIRAIAARPAPEKPILRGLHPTGPAEGVREVPVFRRGAPIGKSDAAEREFAYASLFEPSVGTVDPVGPRAPLCYCGALPVFTTIEQVPASWWNWPLIGDVIWQFNQIMDIFRTSGYEPGYGDNGANEVVGWLDDATLQEDYGVSWVGTIAVAYMWFYVDCGEIFQVDIIFNSEYSWTDDFDFALGNADVINYAPVALHEFGHAWGAQRGETCTEDYSYPELSIMHAYYTTIIEDAEGVHAWDAAALRANYDDQTPVTFRIDLGVESYYSNAGFLTNSTLDQAEYYPGSPFTLSNITIENMSSSPTEGVRVRLFLSENNIISTNDYAVDAYWHWSPLNPAQWWTGDLSAFIPDDVPPGEYWFGAIITHGGSSYLGDAYPQNNNTYLREKVTVIPVPPANDLCDDAAQITTGLLPFDTTGATVSNPAVNCGDVDTIYNDVWYRFIAPCDGQVSVSTCDLADFDTTIVLYDAGRGTCPPHPSDILACNDSGAACDDFGAEVLADVVAGQELLIRLGGSVAEGQGEGHLRLIFFDTLPNDRLTSALPVSEGVTPFTNRCAQSDGAEHPRVCEPEMIESDVWFSYDPLCTGMATISTCNLGGLNTAMAVYEPGPGGDHLLLLACDDNSGPCEPGASSVTVPVALTGTYIIRVGSPNPRAEGSGDLIIECVPQCPDTNGDGAVNFADLELLLDHWGEVVPPGTLGDANGSGVVNFFDLNLLLDHWGEACP